MSAAFLDLHIGRPVKILLGAALALALAAAIFLPASRGMQGQSQAIARARGDYMDTLALVERYKVLQKSMDNKKSVLLEEPLFTYIEKIGRELKLEKRIDYLRPEKRTLDDGSMAEVVHVSLKGITLDEFVRFLYRIEIQKREILIDSIFIKKDGKQNLETQMTLQKRS
ncbi:MAG: hypothetical protein V3571_11365 [Pseudodesulfovibrio sp.]